MAITFNEFQPGDELSALDIQTYAMNQVIMRFANSATRDSVLSGFEVHGMIAYLDDVKYLTSYDGSSWTRISTITDFGSVDTRPTLINLYMGTQAYIETHGQFWLDR